MESRLNFISKELKAMFSNYSDFSSLGIRELLSLTLRETNESMVVDELISRFSTLRELASATIAELKAIKGLGPAKASALLASIELAKRLNSPPQMNPENIRGPLDVVNLVMGEMRLLDREHFRAVLMNTKNRVLRIETVSIGTLNSSVVHPRELFKSAIRHSAAAVILVHNHPSGSADPSREDIQITNRLIEAGKLLGIEILDHIIIGDGTFISLKDKSLL